MVSPDTHTSGNVFPFLLPLLRLGQKEADGASHYHPAPPEGPELSIFPDSTALHWAPSSQLLNLTGEAAKFLHEQLFREINTGFLSDSPCCGQCEDGHCVPVLPK